MEHKTKKKVNHLYSDSTFKFKYICARENKNCPFKKLSNKAIAHNNIEDKLLAFFNLFFIYLLLKLIILNFVTPSYVFAQNLSANENIEKLQYATDWIPIGNKSENNQKKIIQDKSLELFNAIYNATLKPLEFKQTQTLNKRWQNEKAAFNQKWLEDLFKLGDKYRNSFRLLSGTKQKIERLHRIKKEDTAQLELIIKKIDSINKQEQEIKKWQKEVNKDLKSMLANIPISIVLVGRIAFSNIKEDRKNLIEILASEMRYVAVKEVNGSRILSYSEIKDYRMVKDLIVKVNSGKAVPVDTYFQDTDKSFKTKNEGYPIFIYLINRIEVYPFSESNDFTGFDINPNKTRSEIFTLSNNEESLKKFGSGEITSFASHKFAPQEKEYILSQMKIGKELNENVNPKIKEFRDDSNKKYKLYNYDLKELSEELNTFLNEKSKLEDKIKQYNINIINEEKSKVLQESDYKVMKERYEKYYKLKETYVNRYEWRYKPVIAKTPEALFKTMAENAYKIKNEVQQENVKISVWVETDNSGTTFKTFKKKDISYKPNIESFRILYLTYYTDPDLISMLNIAFKVKWKKKLNMSLEIFEQELVDTFNQLVWRQESPETTSYRRYKSQKPSGENWRLPSIYELQSLKEQIEKYKINVFSRLNWPNEIEIPYLSSQTFRDKNGQTLFHSYNFLNKSITKVDSGSEIYILWVKPK